MDYPQSTAFTFGAVDKLSVINTVFHTFIHSYPLVIHASKSVYSCQQYGGSDGNREYEVGDHEDYEESIRMENGLSR